MPLSCAKAFRPTIALLYCTGKEETAETSFEARVSFVVSMPVLKGSTSGRTRIAITTSSSEVLPARSPSPLTAHSIWRAPPMQPASEFATEAEVVVAMHREDRLIGVGHTRDHLLEQSPI